VFALVVGTLYRQEKEVLHEFLQSLVGKYALIAPVKDDLVRFKETKDAKEVHLDKNSYFPVKEYFFGKHEVLFTFDGKGFSMPKMKPEKKVLFGLRRCDLNGILHQDQVYLKDIHDPYYAERRKNTLLIGYHCPTAPSEYCFCGSLDLKECQDLMFFDRDDHFLVEVGSNAGEKFIAKFRRFFSTAKEEEIVPLDRKIPGADRLKKTDINMLYDHPDWKKGVDICLSCAACTNLCPTCYCFEIHDDMSAKDPKKGRRSRQWSSCQLQEFSRIAGDHVFREKREERFKHRIYHQLDYFKDKHGFNLCVGCGRCISGCPTRIDFVKIINEMR
jgi:sulfhydrogenase subunit beta (sulfur reductase)